MQRPKRTTRGVKPQRTAEQQAEDQRLYASLFGAQALEEQEQVDPQQQRKEREKQSRRDILKLNIQKYPYVRAFHYYYEIDTIPRLKGHPSYALMEGFGFGWKYSQEKKLYKEQTLGSIINRKYIGLPRCSDQPKKQEYDDEKWGDIFQLEERRYSIDRILYVCKVLQGKLQELVKNEKIKEFRNIVKRDPQFQILWEQDTSLEEKEYLLTKKIKELQRKKQLRVKLANDEKPKVLVEAIQKNQSGVEVVGIEEEEGSLPLKKIKLS